VQNAPRRGARLQHLIRCAAEISCVRRATVTSSQRNEQFRAFNKSGARSCFDSRFRCISLGARVECFPAIAPTHSHRRESGRAQLRSDNDCVRQLRLLRSCSVSQRTASGSPIFQNSGVDFAVGRIAVSWRMHFRARAARVWLRHAACSRRPVGDATRG